MALDGMENSWSRDTDPALRPSPGQLARLKHQQLTHITPYRVSRPEETSLKQVSSASGNSNRKHRRVLRRQGKKMTSSIMRF
ncbi:uncharacterized [Tachysurus ichikawai]